MAKARAGRWCGTDVVLASPFRVLKGVLAVRCAVAVAVAVLSVASVSCGLHREGVVDRDLSLVQPSQVAIAVGEVTSRYCVGGADSDGLRFDVTLSLTNTGTHPVYLPVDAWSEVGAVFAAVNEANAAKGEWAYSMSVTHLSSTTAPSEIVGIAPAATRQLNTTAGMLVDKKGTFVKPGRYLLYFPISYWYSTDPRLARNSRKLRVDDRVRAEYARIGPIPFDVVADYKAEACRQP